MLEKFVLVCVVLLAGACNIVPPEGALSCREDGDCPSSWSCVRGLCFNSSDPDLPPLPEEREGERCFVELEKACSDADRREQLVCLDEHWRSVGSCAGATHCDSREGATRGTCQPILEACLGKEPGTVLCQSGVRKVCSDDLFQADASPCGDNQHCEGDSEVSCVCNAGFEANEAGSCEKDACPEGYARASEDCADIDECLPALERCGAHRACTNTEGSFACGACEAGYQEAADGCVDIDECQQNPCGEQRTCTNEDGTFRCGECARGYQLQDAMCTDVDECAAGSCGANRACENTAGSFSCGACSSGYQELDEACVEIDECAQGLCGPNRACSNTPGSYSCGDCDAGYALSDEMCLDIDECAQGLCGVGRSCNNVAGSYMCGGCESGFSDDGTNCTDIDECAAGSCGAGRECSNSPGSFTCGDCSSGYRDDLSGQCLDINECMEMPGICGNNPCLNYAGGYNCLRMLPTCPRCLTP